MSESFGTRLVERISTYGPLCVGIDPSVEVLEAWGQEQSANGLARFVDAVLSVLPPNIAAVKPQAAFFERFGAAGWSTLEHLLTALRERGHLVILDAKRSDIGSSAEGYADAYLGNGPMSVDAVTATPYLGVGALAPLLAAANTNDRGVFILCRTSNPEGRSIQDVTGHDGRPVWQQVQDTVAEWNQGTNIGSMGLVIGATLRDHTDRLAAHNGPILAPGFGRQGATAEDFPLIFSSVADRTLANYSRFLLNTGPSGFVDAIAETSAKLISSS